MIERICERCGARTMRKASDLGRFCSRPCFYAARGKDTKPRKQRSDRGERSAVWKGGKSIRDGYIVLNDGNRREHIVIVEGVLGHKLPDGAIVHHVNRLRSDNRNCNLVALNSAADHVELHRKMRIREAGGDPWATRAQRVA